MSKRKRKTHLNDRRIKSMSIKTAGATHAVDVANDLYVSDDLDSEFDRNPSLFAWYATLAEDALSVAKIMKLRLEETMDELRVKYRAHLGKSGGRVTVAEVDSHVNRDVKIRKLKRRLIRAEAVAGKMKSYKEAFNQRRDMLISKGAHRRAEGSLHILEGEVRKRTRKSKET